MIRALIIAAAISAHAPAVIAQTAPPASAESLEPGEAEFEATAEVFGAKMQAMQQEMQAAAADADAARRTAALDAIEARYQPDADAFVVALEAFVNQQAAAGPETERAGMLANLTEAVTQVRSVPRLVRTQVEQAAQAAPPAR